MISISLPMSDNVYVLIFYGFLLIWLIWLVVDYREERFAVKQKIFYNNQQCLMGIQKPWTNLLMAFIDNK